MDTSNALRGAAMEGGGAYNANSALQASGAALALPAFEAAAAETRVGEGEGPLLIADYGASEGWNSIRPLQRAIEILRGRIGARRAIVVAHTDLPGNDFSSLFATVDHGESPYGAGDANVFPSAVGRSFYRPALAKGQVDLAWSSYAAQWLSRTPGGITGHIVAWRGSAPERRAFAEQGRSDWLRFLSLRSAELRSGAHFVVSLPCAEDDGVHPAAALFDAASETIADMTADGSLVGDAKARMAIPVYPRTRAETLEPFSSGQLALRLVASEFLRLPDAGFARFEADGDAHALAARRAGFFRATFGPSLAQALDSAEERRRFLGRFETVLRGRLAGLRHPLGAIVAVLRLAKPDE